MKLSRSTVRYALLLLSTLLPPGAGWSAEPAPAFAEVWRVAGSVTARGEGQSAQRTLVQGDKVFVGEQVAAGPGSEAVLRTLDAGVIAVRPGAIFRAERFVAKGGRSDGMTVRLITGALRVLTGWIGKLNREEHRIVTPTATIGVRGTDHEPFVLDEELAAQLGQKAGTYDKVNSGGTSLAAGGGVVDIDPGRVGFARAAPKTKTRALMTLALPVLLERIPDFYVPGRFDDEIDAIAQRLDREAAEALERRRAEPQGATEPAAPAAELDRRESPLWATGRARRDDPCGADGIARKWLNELDRAIGAGDAKAVMALFAPGTGIRIHTRNPDGTLGSTELSAAEFARSTEDALKGLREFNQRRPATTAQPETAGQCRRIAVKSIAVEQGRQNGVPYRFESVENYVLEHRDGRWVATSAETTQR